MPRVTGTLTQTAVGLPIVNVADVAGAETAGSASAAVAAIPDATADVKGLATAAQVAKLAGIAEGAQVNPAFGTAAGTAAEGNDARLTQVTTDLAPRAVRVFATCAEARANLTAQMSRIEVAGRGTFVLDGTSVAADSGDEFTTAIKRSAIDGAWVWEGAKLAVLTPAGTVAVSGLKAPPIAPVRSGVLNLTYAPIEDCPVTGVVAILRASNAIAIGSGLYCPIVGRGGSAVQAVSTYAPLLSGAPNRPALIFGPTSAHVTCPGLAAFFNAFSSGSWSVYARMSYPRTADVITYSGAIYAVGGAYSVALGFTSSAYSSYTRRMFISGNGITSSAPIQYSTSTHGAIQSHVWSADGTAATFRRDGESFDATIGAYAHAYTQLWIGANSTSDANAYRGEIECLIFVDHKLTDEEYVLLDNWETSVCRATLLLEGDSLTQAGSGFESVGDWIANLSRNSLRVENYGRGGQTQAQMLANIATRSLSRVRADHPTMVLNWCWVNSIAASVSAATLLANAATFRGLCVAAGALPRFATCLPAGTLTGPQETERLALNAGLLAAYPTETVDVAAIAALQTTADTTYYVDTVHPTTTGAITAAGPMAEFLAASAA